MEADYYVNLHRSEIDYNISHESDTVKISLGYVLSSYVTYDISDNTQ